MKRIYLSLIIAALAASSLQAESLTQLEGSFKTGPAIILIAIGMPFLAPQPAKERIAYTFTQGLTRTDVVEIALRLHDVCEEIGLPSFAKTMSG